jgi:hypothetical protein
MNRPVIAFCIVLTALVALVAFLHGTVTLSDEVYARIRPGMSRTEVEALVGRPPGDYARLVFKKAKEHRSVFLETMIGHPKLPGDLRIPIFVVCTPWTCRGRTLVVAYEGEVVLDKLMSDTTDADEAVRLLKAHMGDLLKELALRRLFSAHDLEQEVGKMKETNRFRYPDGRLAFIQWADTDGGRWVTKQEWQDH